MRPAARLSEYGAVLQAAPSPWFLLSLLLLAPGVAVGESGDVMGPVVRNNQGEFARAWLRRDQLAAEGTQAVVEASVPPPPEEERKESKGTIAEYLDKQLENEFQNEEAAHAIKTDLSETLVKEKGSTLEQVVKVSTKKPKQNTTADGTSNTTQSSNRKWDTDPTGTAEDEVPERDKDSMEQDVDRLIDADNNEYVLSRSKSGVALTLDPLLIQDLTVILSASALFGSIFEAIKQPVLNGYIIAGSLVGPDGFALIKEMVQVESLAQVGVQLLLFGLGMEFSIEKLREVGAVAILGGFIQIVLFIVICAVGALAIGGAMSEGIFVGALVSMSSTSVVIKSMGDTRTSVGQIVIGTLILQDCTVGLMFALMPVLSSLGDPKSGLDPEATGEIVLVVLKVLLKLAGTLVMTATLSRTLLPRLISTIRNRCSDELFQMVIIGYCLSCAWVCGKLGISHELGAFLAGIMISTMDQHEQVLHSTEQVRNVFAGLFLASIGLVISPIFILQHIRILSACAAMLLVIKGFLIALVVWNFKFSWNTSLCVGFSLAQVGEFAFVLLSLASQLGLITNRLSMLLLGVTAISLLTTPLVLSLSHHFLHFDAGETPAEANGSARSSKAGADHKPNLNGNTAHGETRVRPTRAIRPGASAGEADMQPFSPAAFWHPGHPVAAQTFAEDQSPAGTRASGARRGIDQRPSLELNAAESLRTERVTEAERGSSHWEAASRGGLVARAAALEAGHRHGDGPSSSATRGLAESRDDWVSALSSVLERIGSFRAAS